MGTQLREKLLTDAEPAKNAIKNVVGHDGPDDLAQLIDGEPQVERDELIAGARGDQPRGRAKCGRGTVGCPGSVRRCRREIPPVGAAADLAAISEQRAATPRPVSGARHNRRAIRLKIRSGMASLPWSGRRGVRHRADRVAIVEGVFRREAFEQEVSARGLGIVAPALLLIGRPVRRNQRYR